MAKSQRVKKPMASTKQVRKLEPVCQHRMRYYVVNESNFKIWRCLECGSVTREAAILPPGGGTFEEKRARSFR